MKWLLVSFLAAACTVATVSHTVRAQEADSAAYRQERGRVVQGHADPRSAQVVSAADDLAGAGLYEEALELLRGLVADRADSAAAKVPAPAGKRDRVDWRVSAWADYWYLEDIHDADTSRPEIRDSVRALLAEIREAPLTVTAKATAAIAPRPSWVERLAPSVMLSSRRASGELDARLRFAGGRLRAGVSAKGQKELFRTGHDNVEFVGGGIDSLDLVAGGATLSYVRERELRNLQVPFIVKAQHYYRPRAGYRSFVHYGITPALELRSANLRRTLWASASAEFRDYYGVRPWRNQSASADSVDVFRAGCEVRGDMRQGSVTASASGLYSGEWYPTGTRPACRTAAAAEARVRVDRGRKFYAALKTEYAFAAERIAGPQSVWDDSIRTTTFLGVVMDDTVPYVNQINTAFDLYAHKFSCAPSLSLRLPAHLELTAAVVWRLARCPTIDSAAGKQLVSPRFVEPRSDGLEPGLEFSFTPPNIDIRQSTFFLLESIPDWPEYRNPDYPGSRGVRVSLSADWQIVRRLSVQAAGEYQFRRYDPVGLVTQRASNFSLSLGLSARL